MQATQLLPPLAASPPYRLAGHLDYAEGRVRFGSLRGRVGRSDLAGEVSITPGPVRPLAVNDVAPGVPVDGPAPSLEAEVRSLHARLHGVSL